jgi:hypothetical protein
MLEKISKLIDLLSEFLAHRKGLVPFFGIFLVGINFVLQYLPNGSFLVESNILLHIGVIVAVLGLMLARAL